MPPAADRTPRIWALLMLELWHREMVDASAPGRSASLAA